MYIRYPANGGGSGILSINGDTTSAQLLAGGTGISVATVGGTTTITNTAPALSTISEVWVTTPAGHGSASNNRVRVYTVTRVNTGSNITYTSDAVNGDYFTINSEGIYAIVRQDRNEDANPLNTSIMGLSRDASSLTANVYDLASPQYLNFDEVAGGQWVGGMMTWVGKLAAGVVIRAHDASGRVLDNTNGYSCIHITQLA